MSHGHWVLAVLVGLTAAPTAFSAGSPAQEPIRAGSAKFQVAPGKYSLQITVLDSISNRTVTTTANFRVKESVAQKLVAENPK